MGEQVAAGIKREEKSHPWPGRPGDWTAWRLVDSRRAKDVP